MLFWTKMYLDHDIVFFSLADQKLVLDGTGWWFEKGNNSFFFNFELNIPLFNIGIKSINVATFDLMWQYLRNYKVINILA